MKTSNVARARRAESTRFTKLFADNFYQDSLAPAAVELTIEDLLPRSEVQFTLGDRHDHFPAHDLPLHVGVGVVFAGVIVAVLLDRLVRRELLQPDSVVVMQARFIVVDENRSRNMHGIDQRQPFLDTALPDAVLHLAGNIDKRHPRWRIEPELFAKAFHVATSPV